MSFDGTHVANDGTVPFRHGQRIAFSHLVSSKFVGDHADLRILRGNDSDRVDLKVPLSPSATLVPVHIGERLPSYFITGGIVFTVLTVPYLDDEYGRNWDGAPPALLYRVRHHKAKKSDEQVVIVGHVLASSSDITLGYEGISNVEVVKFNGTPVHSLRQLAGLVDACEDEYLRFELHDRRSIILPRRKAKEETKRVLEINGIPQARSKDLADVNLTNVTDDDDDADTLAAGLRSMTMT
jgi:hypothetical protein